MQPPPGPYLILGGTGSLGRVLVQRLLPHGAVTVFSRDEEKHRVLRRTLPAVRSIIGDVRDYRAVLHALHDTSPRIVINAAAMKQIDLCEEHPYQALQTNVMGAHNVVQAAREHARGRREPLTVLSVSTDKAVKPVSAYGMSKALQERVHLEANHPPYLVHTCVRYGNVLDSTGSVIPVFKEKITRGEPVSITDPGMTRFLLSLNEAVDVIVAALADTEGGTTFVPKVRSATVGALADALIGRKRIKKIIIGARPGEKIHEVLISEEELPRTEDCGAHFVVHAIRSGKRFAHVTEEYSSQHVLMLPQEVAQFLTLREVIDMPKSRPHGKVTRRHTQSKRVTR